MAAGQHQANVKCPQEQEEVSYDTLFNYKVDFDDYGYVCYIVRVC